MFYIDIFKALARYKVRYLLVGGLAVNLHGIPRMTMDMDLVVALDAANLEGFVAAAASLGLKPVLPLPLSDLLDPAKRAHWVKERNMIAFALRPPQPDGPTLDLLLDPPINIDEAFARAVSRDLGSVTVALASVEDMILLKEESGRAQDLADLEHLRRIRGEGGSR